jgi:hypothetical protein
MILNDPIIRSALLRKLNNQQPKPKAVIEELHVHNGCAIADVVSLHTEAHCYEIKGAGDKIERILEQGVYYNRTFRKITLITTSNHLAKAKALAPDFWGIILAESDGSEIRLKHIRGAQNNPSFNKEKAAHTLWKSEMLSLLQGDRLKRRPRDFLAQLISETKNKVELSQNISTLLHRRVSNHPPKWGC